LRRGYAYASRRCELDGGTSADDAKAKMGGSMCILRATRLPVVGDERCDLRGFLANWKSNFFGWTQEILLGLTGGEHPLRLYNGESMA